MTEDTHFYQQMREIKGSKPAGLLTCAECGKQVQSARAGLYNGKCWNCAMGYSTPQDTVKRLRLALDTLKKRSGYPNCQFVPGLDGYAALSALEDHIKTLEAIVEPRIKFKDLACGERFHFLKHGVWTEETFLKLDSVTEIGVNAASLRTGKLCFIAPNTSTKIVAYGPKPNDGGVPKVEPHHYSA